MFALRNIGTDDAVDALAAGFVDDSALFKYVPHALHSSRYFHMGTAVYIYTRC
jgi:hypothetical protein